MSVAIRLPETLVADAKKHAELSCRTVPKQIEYWTLLGRAAEENPDLPLSFIKETLLALAEAKEGKVSSFKRID